MKDRSSTSDGGPARKTARRPAHPSAAGPSIALECSTRYAFRGDRGLRSGSPGFKQGRLNAFLVRLGCAPARPLRVDSFARGLPVNEAFRELADLWARRDRLNQAEWARLYDLVMQALAWSAPPREEASLVLGAEGRQAWRDSFFADKVVMPAIAGNSAMSRELTPGGLGVFYRNYLRDQVRKTKRRPEYQGYKGAEDDLVDEGTVSATPPMEDGSDTSDGDSADACSIDPSAFSEGLDAAAIRESARGFLEEADDWVVIYLALHFCHGRDRLPLSKIHQQFQIPSYHYKARELGIAPPRGGYEDFEAFGDTMLGRWLQDCRVPLDPDRIETIRQAFDLLCLEAFREASDRGLADFEEDPS
jgi:hypothetical protein